MADKENVIVEVNMDLDAVESELKIIDVGLEKARLTLMKESQSVVAAVLQVRDAIRLCDSSITAAINEQFSSWIGEYEKTQSESYVAGLGDKAYDSIFALLLESMKALGQGEKSTPSKTKETNEFPRLGPGNTVATGADKSSTSSDTSGINGLISSGFGDPMSFSAAMGDLMESVGGVTAKLKESALAWGEQTAAKIADKAEDMAILTLYAVDYVKQFGAMITQLAANTAAWVANTAAKVASTAAEWAHIAAVTVWNGICATATAVTSAFGAAMSVLTSPITLVVGAVAALIAIVVLLVKNWDTVKEVAVNTWNAIVSAFGKAGAWFKSAVLDPLANGFKGAVNGVIGFLNGLIAGVVKGINGLINLLNKLSFAVPDWVPGMGGKTFGFNLKPLTAPQIPYLAKGAVLPANRPFLAMVGDQRHGTNIEAPLATIQEAMAITMEDFVASNMAGHEATVGVLKEILEAVLGIHIGDADIGKAVQRYQQKMAVVYGRPY